MLGEPSIRAIENLTHTAHKRENDGNLDRLYRGIPIPRAFPSYLDGVALSGIVDSGATFITKDDSPALTATDVLF